MSFFENTRKPVGFGGKIMVAMMNLGHSPVARWGLRCQRRESPEFKPDCHSERALCGVAGQRGTYHLCKGLV